MQRRDPQLGWQVRMLANEICLHNPDSETRAYRVQRPHLPAGAGIVAGTGPLAADDLVVPVTAGQTSRVWVSSWPVVSRATEGACSILDTPK